MLFDVKLRFLRFLMRCLFALRSVLERQPFVPRNGRQTVEDFLEEQSRWFQLIVKKVRDRLGVKEWAAKYESFSEAKELELLKQTVQSIQAASR